MRAAALVAPRRIELVDVPAPALGPHDVRVRPAAVGLCGTDFHVYSGESNFNQDARGFAIPLERAPQILGHELTGTVLEVGRAVSDLRAGERVLLDQGLNCRSTRREPPCEYCASGHSHQCEFYAEHGLTGLPGGFAEELVLPAVNAVRIESELPFRQAVLAEPLACVLHALDFAGRAQARYGFGARGERVRAAAILGAGPAGLFFLQALRSRLGFDGPVLVSDPSPGKRTLAEALGGEAVVPEELHERVLARTGGRRLEFLVEASGAGPVFAEIPCLIRKQATVLLYGIGHGGAALELLNPLQWREAVLVTSVGASGGFDPDGRPSIYREALGLIERGTLRVEALLTHTYHGLSDVPRAFAGEHENPDYVKGVAILS